MQFAKYNSNWIRLQYFVRLRRVLLLIWFLIFSHDLTWQTQDAILNRYVRMDAPLDEKASSRIAAATLLTCDGHCYRRGRQTPQLGSCNFSRSIFAKRGGKKFNFSKSIFYWLTETSLGEAIGILAKWQFLQSIFLRWSFELRQTTTSFGGTFSCFG